MSPLLEHNEALGLLVKQIGQLLLLLDAPLAEQEIVDQGARLGVDAGADAGDEEEVASRLQQRRIVFRHDRVCAILDLVPKGPLRHYYDQLVRQARDRNHEVEVVAEACHEEQ